MVLDLVIISLYTKLKDETIFFFFFFTLLTMVISLSRSIGHDDLHAAVRGVVGPLSLLTVAVTDIVGIGLLKLSRNRH